MATKEKVVGIKLFANKRLKPTSIYWKGEMVTAYPLYCSVTYNRENTKFRVYIEGQSIMVGVDLAQITNNISISKKIESYLKYVESVVRLCDKFEKSFAVRDLNKRLFFYNQTVYSCLKNSTIGNLIQVISAYKPDVEAPDITKELFSFIIELSESHEEMTVFDWFREGKSKLFNRIEGNKSTKEVIIEIVDDLLKNANPIEDLGPL
mgnify:CR=1 FL=1